MFLDRIVEKKREDVERARATRPLGPPPAPRAPGSFAAALARPGISLICEIKRRSPSKGPLRLEAQAKDWARLYQDAGASAISVLTEPHEFGGSVADLEDALSVATIPILRKDFVIDPYQIAETAHIGAQAFLLIVSILEQSQLVDMIEMGRELGLDALVEVHDEAELERALATPAKILGINNRDLKTLEIDHRRAEQLIPRIPAGMIIVAESGYSNPEAIHRAHQAGAHAFLIGESLMRSEDPAAAIRRILS